MIISFAPNLAAVHMELPRYARNYARRWAGAYKPKSIFPMLRAQKNRGPVPHGTDPRAPSLFLLHDCYVQSTLFEA